MTEPTIEQRWDDVGMKRDGVAISLWKSSGDYYGPKFWDYVSTSIQEKIRRQADALLSLIEEAVRKARKNEHTHPHPHEFTECFGSDDYRCPRCEELEPGKGEKSKLQHFKGRHGSQSNC